jgi:hypothetical protein
MPNATRDGPARHRHHPYNHGLEHCPTHCRYCGPDAGAWDVGEFAVGLLAAVFAVVRGLARHPVVTVLLTAAVALTWTLVTAD